MILKLRTVDMMSAHTALFLSSPAVQLEGIHVDFGGREALCHVDLDFHPGRLSVIAGANGAGKSTLLEVVAGTLRPSAGRVAVHAGSLAFVPQRAAVSDRLPLTVRDVATIGAWGRLGPWQRADAATRRAVDDALDRLALRSLQRRPFTQLSGGQRQRTLLAQGIARGAELLLLDEPTTALDADSSSRIRGVIESEAARGVAVLCVTHDDALISMADRVVRLESGRVSSDTGAELR
jgi:zinc/manganese transport system ATP-binding protein